MSACDDRVDLVLVHLSDTHFREVGAGDVHDPDLDLRKELEKDLRTVRGERSGPRCRVGAHGVVVDVLPRSR